VSGVGERVFLSLGSNLGDRLGHLRAALDALDLGYPTALKDISRLYETEPVEVSGPQPPYLNLVVEVDSRISPMELLRFCQGVEAGLGRRRKGEKAPRTIDIDILLFDDVVGEWPELSLPHPGILRAFNLVGIADIDAGLRIPGAGLVVDLLRRSDRGGIREVEGVELRC